MAVGVCEARTMKQRSTSPAELLLTVPFRLPGRVLGTLAAPLQANIARDVRRSLGVQDEPEPPELDPSLAFLPPDGEG